MPSGPFIERGAEAPESLSGTFAPAANAPKAHEKQAMLKIAGAKAAIFALRPAEILPRKPR
jgi:hypothetical protein